MPGIPEEASSCSVSPYIRLDKSSNLAKSNVALKHRTLVGEFDHGPQDMLIVNELENEDSRNSRAAEDLKAVGSDPEKRFSDRGTSLLECSEVLSSSK